VLLARLGLLAQAVHAVLQHLGVGQDELGLDDLDVAHGVHVAVHVHHVVVLEAAHHVQDGLGLADVGQELVAKTLALARALDQPGDVGELHRGPDHLLRVGQPGQGVHARVRHGHDGLVGFDGAEGVVGGLRVLSPGESVEQRGFSDVGEADDAYAQCHFSTLWMISRRAGKRSLLGAAVARRRSGAKPMALTLGWPRSPAMNAGGCG